MEHKSGEVGAGKGSGVGLEYKRELFICDCRIWLMYNIVGSDIVCMTICSNEMGW